MRVLELLVVAVCLQAVQADKDNIVKLTKFNFDENVKRGTWMVKFYAPWCSHCQRLKPIWEKLADHAVSQEWPVKIAEVDCTVSKNICQKANVKGFPEVVLITDGKPKGKYKGEVGSAKAFEAWLSKQGVLGDSTAASSAAAAAPSEKAEARWQEAQEVVRPTATATHSKAIKAMMQNMLYRFPTESLVTNIYAYFFVTMSSVVFFYLIAFQMLEEEHEKDS
ncbi:unnamed protein product [Durusdinium trenchii]|uniref:Thioredoxin domain-containing protein n=1 Tax=Durusdinium trenchii TaxID=1381693 RepID=A0ABP0NV43_9DINO